MEVLPEILPLLIPILALLIGLVVIGGVFFVQPVVKALTRLADARSASGAALGGTQLDERLTRLEQGLQKLLEEREFDRQLSASVSRAVTPGQASDSRAGPREEG